MDPRRGAKHRLSQGGKVGSRFWVSLSLLAAFVFTLAVFWQVLPRSSRKVREESPARLKERLAEERSSRRRELEEKLSEWQMKNEKLRREIERLKARKP